jgi:hypothetical protein
MQFTCYHIYIYTTFTGHYVYIYDPSWSWSYGSWIYIYLCNQCLSPPLTLWVRTPPRWGVLDTTLCDQVCQWFAARRWFSPSTHVSSTNKTDHYDITEILLKVALNTITQTLTPIKTLVFSFFISILIICLYKHLTLSLPGKKSLKIPNFGKGVIRSRQSKIPKG